MPETFVFSTGCSVAFNGRHCWHVRQLILSDPPQQKERCCWCGEQRTAPRHKEVHGKFIYDWRDYSMPSTIDQETVST